ncbi:MAG: DNA methyltransferase [Candidatus Bathyarchaeota archaeon]|nr:DNA methyltransferase [Candidatus Bathyarchaeota archaeon]
MSLAELTSFLEARRKIFDVNYISKDFFALSFAEKIKASTIDDLGGIIKIGNLVADIPTEIVRRSFLQRNQVAQIQLARAITDSGIAENILEANSKILFGVSVYCAEKSLQSLSKVIQRFIGSTIKRQLAKNNKKSKFMGFAKDRRQPQLSHVEVLKKNLIEKQAEVLFCIGEKQTWIASTIAVHNPFEFQKRDICKPSQRKIFAIPPRLARIMINLAFCTPGKLLIDPFCGVGTILQEALLMRAKVVGMDINQWCVSAAEENLKWIKREYKLSAADFRIIHGDACNMLKKVGFEQADCIVTEPDLGPALRHVPTERYAFRIIKKLQPLYFDFIGEAYNVLKKGGRLVLVTPYIKTRSEKRISMEIEEKSLDIGFQRVYPFKREHLAEGAMFPDGLITRAPLVDIEARHKIGREIHIFHK